MNMGKGLTGRGVTFIYCGRAVVSSSTSVSIIVLLYTALYAAAYRNASCCPHRQVKAMLLPYSLLWSINAPLECVK